MRYIDKRLSAFREEERRKNDPENTYVYCFQEQSRSVDAPIKIGMAQNIEQRFTNVQVGNPMALNVYGVIGPFRRSNASLIENSLHAAMAKHRIRGEWFSGRALPIFDEYMERHGHKFRLINGAVGEAAHSEQPERPDSTVGN